MRQIDFYQIGSAGLEHVMLVLLNKTLAAKQKALILCPLPAAKSIDTALWSFDAESWIPHGLDDANGADHCYVWISSDMNANPIDAKYLFLLHGSTPKQWDGFVRCFCLFDGKSDLQLKRARNQWKEWQTIGETTLGYYAQNDEGEWVKKSVTKHGKFFNSIALKTRIPSSIWKFVNMALWLAIDTVVR